MRINTVHSFKFCGIAAILICMTMSVAGQAKSRSFEIYAIDVEGGQATLIVTPDRPSRCAQAVRYSSAPRHHRGGADFSGRTHHKFFAWRREGKSVLRVRCGAAGRSWGECPFARRSDELWKIPLHRFRRLDEEERIG